MMSAIKITRSLRTLCRRFTSLLLIVSFLFAGITLRTSGFDVRLSDEFHVDTKAQSEMVSQVSEAVEHDEVSDDRSYDDESNSEDGLSLEHLSDRLSLTSKPILCNCSFISVPLYIFLHAWKTFFNVFEMITYKMKSSNQKNNFKCQFKKKKDMCRQMALPV
jgi:hypothetical protein